MYPRSTKNIEVVHQTLLCSVKFKNTQLYLFNYTVLHRALLPLLHPLVCSLTAQARCKNYNFEFLGVLVLDFHLLLILPRLYRGLIASFSSTTLCFQMGRDGEVLMHTQRSLIFFFYSKGMRSYF